MEKVVFLDRDGTINTEVDYLYKAEDLVFFDGVKEALASLREAGYRLVVITNQAGVARGYYKEERVRELHLHMNELLGGVIDAFYYCPHHPVHGIGEYKQNCECRKPKIGMFLQAEKDFPVDKANSFMIGDKLIDVEAGRNYGVRGILVGTGYGSQYYQEDEDAAFDYYAPTLKDAAAWILDQKKEEN